ncbi:MAG TPA: acyclic terpene utilization AtuA family protein [Acidimicrobiia bacterium]|nr:acyclic terpene utilization AtuA family protein [Acidimicrobiia bacterium]
MTTLRIANCSGFFGDRLAAAREMVEGGPIDVLTGDYLAELTMAILWRTRSRQPDGGYASTFLTQMEEVLGTCLERGIKVVSNAGGLNPAGLAERLEKLAGDLGYTPKIAYLEGDDLLSRLPELEAQGHEFRHLDRDLPLRGSGVTPLTANAYLGGWGIKTALEQGADVVICGRVTDAALVIGPAAWHHRWRRDDWDSLAGALVAGHIIECGAQATGGNYAFFAEVPGLAHIGFPLVEMEADGSFVVTKHPHTGGLVSVGTVTAQLLYEISGNEYLNPDVTALFDTIRLEEVGPDRVAVSQVQGVPPPADLKVALNYLGGYRNAMTFGLAGLNIEEKARLLEEALWTELGGKDQFATAHAQLIASAREDPETNDDALSYLRVTVMDPDQEKVGRRFSRTAVEFALSHYPGFFLTSPPGEATPYAVYWPTTIPASLVPMRVVMGDDSWDVPSAVPETPAAEGAFVSPLSNQSAPPADNPPLATHHSKRVPLGALAGARSGDKGGNANVGFWVRSQDAYDWLAAFLTVDELLRLLPEAAGLRIERHDFPNLWALNFVINGLLGEGVSSSTRTDPQAKSLGEFLRAKLVPIPESLLPNQHQR